MALSATIYVFAIDLADSDRGIYTSLELRVARHPSETAEYLLTRVLAYCLEGNTGIDFKVQNNTVRHWYHAPWLHYGANGREWHHGLTGERQSRPGDDRHGAGRLRLRQARRDSRQRPAGLRRHGDRL